jgi:BirA family transcriptional regulator, biotin operon repressor / biotin---[acetyl-CoA-carboxylase] ligase
MLSSYTYIGKNHLHFEEIDSTNVYATLFLAKSSPIEGTVISADYQNAGKGQFDRNWISDKGKNTIMSIILYPQFISAADQAYLNILISVSLITWLKQFNDHFKIKWPNDLFYKTQKIGGILIQNQISGSNLKSSIIGIGINVNQDNFPETLRQPATSLKNILNQELDLKILQIELCQFIENNYNKYKNQQISKPELLNLYNENLFGKESEVLIQYPDGISKIAVIKGLDPLGRLILKNDVDTISLIHGMATVQY